MTERTILVLGARGQLGRALLPRLAVIGNVVAWDRATLDLEHAAVIAPALDRLHPDLIINAAAYTAVDRAEQEIDRAFAVNAAAPRELAFWAAAHSALLVHYSTDYVFAGNGATPATEESIPAPQNVYGASKYAGEQAIRDSGCAHLILRTSWLYDGEGVNFLTTMLNLMRQRESISVVSDQIGAPCSASWLADATVGLLARDARGTVNVTTSGETSWYGFAVAIRDEAERLGLELRIRTIVPIKSADWPAAAKRPANSRLSLERLKAYGLTPPNWRDALHAVLNASIKSGAVTSKQ